MSAREKYDVAGRTVFVTGAARGIGAASAERLHACGANVALVGLEPELLEERAARLGARATFCEADVTDLAALERAVEETVSRFGGIDVAIANAGIAFSGSLLTEPVEHVERTLAVNLLGVWRTDRAVIGEIQRRQGYLLNIASLAAATHAPLMGPYTAAKAGVEALTDSLRMEAAMSGTRVGCAYFGFIDTDLVRASFAERSTADMMSSLPAFMSRSAPVGRAVDAIVRGVERRAARVWYPRWVGPMLALRGVLQPLNERRVMSDPELLQRAMREAEVDGRDEDPVLGVAAKVLADHPERSGASQAAR
jgi:NAD(P)-dependent dehydrogenase (short-subunit alcohol dehydrogenase family)